MPSWVNRTVLSGSSVDRNGTNSHTCTFTAATSGNLLVAVGAGAVTFTTPSGWSLLTSAINYTGLYVFTKTASSGESSFSTTHNAANYPILGIVYEFPSGTTAIANNSATGLVHTSTITTPDLTGLSGTYSPFAIRSFALNRTDSTFSTAWSSPSIEDYDSYTVAAATDGVGLSIAYDDGDSGSTFTPSSVVTVAADIPSGEGISFALDVPAVADLTAVMWVI